jgi:hypothetical protein
VIICTESAVAQDLPGRCADHGERRVLQAAIRAVIGGDREIELAVFEHLGPDAAVDAASQMLDELAVEERIDRLARASNVQT